MVWLARYIEALSKRLTLNSALCYVVLWSIYLGMCMSLTVRDTRKGDWAAVLLALAFTFIGVVSVMINAVSVHAVVRRLLAAPLVKP